MGDSTTLIFVEVKLSQSQDFYGNTGLANLCLAKSSPKSQYQYMKFLSEVTYPCLQYMTEAVREGKNQIQSVFGTSEKDIFKAMYSSKEEQQRFSNAMDDAWSLYGEEVMSALDLSCFHVVCDLGGCSDAFAKKYISLYPNSTVTIFDLPEVVERAKSSASSEEHRIIFQGGDFFNDPVPEAELYILSRILHDWDDDKCVTLLTKLYKACKPGGGVLLVETVLNEDRSGPLEALIYSMVMLLKTEGKERTSSEYNVLLGAAGFKEIQFRKRRIFDVIFGRK
ncbi:acetylserotonin O-methyltransferase-like [Sceloporus undulatus]|uniref:acetylserotonin O-methyltransferase-like n=1 Tax=Sceloporus undulatus TaxID=8520 RepID=UPI001C4B18E6|nr:acetylserotonin O-methyltransferase-like [Sceloporus undulatus]